MFWCLVGLLIAALWYAPPVETIFTDNVTVLSVEVVEEWLPIRSPMAFNNTIIFPDTTQYQLPASIQRVDQIVDQFISGLLYFVGADSENQRNAWSLNPATGEFTRYETLMIETACGSVDVSHTLWNLWSFSTQSDGVYLCHHERGIVGEALPTGYIWLTRQEIDNVAMLFESPNTDHVLFVGIDAEKSANSVTFGESYDTFSYSVDVNELVSFGNVIHPHFNARMYWADDTTAIYFTFGMGNRNTYSETFTTFNLRDHSVIKIAPPPRNLAYEAEYLENPPRIDRFFNEDGYCVREIYDVLSRISTLYDMQNVCYPEEISQYPERIYYRGRGQGLVRYNALTGEHTTLFQDDVEMVYNISSDEHYAFVVLDEHERRYHDPWQTYERPDIYDARLALVDLVNDKELYSMPIDFLFWPAVFTTVSYFSAGQNSQGVFPPDGYAQISREVSGKYESILLHRESDSIVMYEIPGLLMDKLDNGWWSLLQRKTREGPFKVDLYNPITEQIVPLIDAPEGFSWSDIEFVENNVFRFIIHSDTFPRIQHTIYTIQVAGIE